MDAFKVASYSLEADDDAEEEAEAEAAEAEGGGEEFWAGLLAERAGQAEAIEGLKMGVGKRVQRGAVNYKDMDRPLEDELKAEEKLRILAEKEAAAAERKRKREEKEKEMERRREEREERKREREERERERKEAASRWVAPPMLEWAAAAANFSGSAAESSHYQIHGFHFRDRKAFVRLLLRYGVHDGSLRQLVRACATDAELKRKRPVEIATYANRFLFHLLEVQRDAILKISAMRARRGGDAEAAPEAAPAAAPAAADVEMGGVAPPAAEAAESPVKAEEAAAEEAAPAAADDAEMAEAEEEAAAEVLEAEAVVEEAEAEEEAMEEEEEEEAPAPVPAPAAAAGSSTSGIELGCSKCRWSPFGCKKCRADAEDAEEARRTAGPPPAVLPPRARARRAR